MTYQEALATGRELEVYLESEQADQKVEEDVLDALWQSNYDVCKLIVSGILEGFNQEEFDEAIAWLKQTQVLTKNYQKFVVEMEMGHFGKNIDSL